jgi:3-oxoacyl-[acyl-carrier-protein] synthase II
MSRRFEMRLKCRMALRLTNGGNGHIGVIVDISPTHFKAYFKAPVPSLKTYHFDIALSDNRSIEGDGRIEKDAPPGKDGESAYIFVIENISIRDELDLLDCISTNSDKSQVERRTDRTETGYAKNRRKSDQLQQRSGLPRVVITGIGVVSSVGIGRAEYWRAIKEHRSGIQEISQFVTDQFPVKIAAEISDKQLAHRFSAKRISRMSRATVFGCLAANLAIEDAEINHNGINKDRTGVALGTTLGTLDWAFKQYHALNSKGYKFQHPYTIAAGSSNAISGEVSVEHGFRGPSVTFSQGCTSSSIAIAYGLDTIQLGRADVMIVGGADAPLNPTVFGAFARSGMLSKSPVHVNENSIQAKDCTGAVLGEGGCVLVLESIQHATQRNAPILAEIVGSGIASDGYDMIYPHPSGRGIGRSIRSAFESSSVQKSDIDLIMGHFAGLRAPNLIEMRVLRREFGQKINGVPVTNVKPFIGYTQGACGAFEIAAACLGFQEAVPWITYNGPQSPAQARNALVSCVGFGGKNVSLILRNVYDKS